MIVIRFADNGSGIKTEVLPRILDLFFTTKDPGKGTDLGLSISYEIVVKKHGGQIGYNSVVGEGTELVIWLPISPKSAISGFYVNSDY